MKKIITLLAIAVCLNTNAQIIITVAGNHAAGYSGDGGMAINAELKYPQAVAIDASGNLYIAESGNQRIRKVNPSGIITTITGNGTCGYSGDGGQATAALICNPMGLAIDAVGNLYIATEGNQRIRKIDTAGIITTVAGNGIGGYSGDGGQATAAELNQPYGIALDAAGNLYIADGANQRIRKVNTAGIITTVAGNGTGAYSGDGGQATAAELWNPQGVAIDAVGNLYIVDVSDPRIRMVNTAGIISTYAGNGTGGISGDGGQATAANIGAVGGIVLDAAGNLYFSDNTTNVRKVNTLGIISSIVGNWGQGYSGDGGPATAAELNYLQGIALDVFGNLYIADAGNHVIREVGKCIPVAPAICMVEVDSLSQNNVIYWDKTAYTADTFYIYRDTANYNYALIGKVPNNSLSLFVDTVRNLYAQNGDPNASSWRYKIAYRDTCGGIGRMSPMSPWHQTVFMITNSSGNFMWNFYQIEGESIPVSQVSGYYFEVDSFSNGHYHVVQSLSASSTSYHDTHYANYPNPTWRSTAMGFNCNPTLRLAGGNNNTFAVRQKSHSNSARQNNTTGLKQVTGNNGQVLIYPNPASNSLNISCSSINNKTIITMYDATGRLVMQHACTNGNQTQIIDIQNIQSGMYFIEVGGTRKIVTVNK